ncbi:MAG: T9SS type A sorting domain-containing protein [Ignavibacterium sp.]|nr:T9SS type A sorting domain-containing protein [Ignavibacterium sp.]
MLIRKKKLHTILFLLLCIFILNINLIAQSFTNLTEITSLTATASTGEKPQSKVWNYGGYWWAVIPVAASGLEPAGTYLWRLDGASWTKLIQLSSTSFKADVKSQNNITHILLTSSSSSSPPSTQNGTLISIEFVPGVPPTYQFWQSRPIPTPIPNIRYFVETATIDIDNSGRMWLAYVAYSNSFATDRNVYVRWSDIPYSIWSDPITISESSTKEDDICALTAFGGNKIGVLWSDQNREEFLFKYHIDGTDPNVWSSLEVAASGSFNDGVADDHINLAVDSRDGTIYAAVKTSYDTRDYIRIGLLVRRSSGNWDPLYKVAENENNNNPNAIGTRPIVLLNETENIVTVCFNLEDNHNDIIYKESSLFPISFPEKYQFIEYGTTGYRDVTSTKQNYNNELVLLFSTNSNSWSGVKAVRTPLFADNGAGYAFNFDGVSNKAIRINTNNNTLGINNSPFTVEAWIKTNTTTSNQSIISKISTVGYELGLNSNGKIYLSLNDGIYNSVSNYSTGIWTHIAATYDLNLVKIYINGVLDFSSTVESPITNNSNEAIIGARRVNETTFDRVMNGSLDELRVWNVARTENEIRATMSKTILENTTGLVGYWRFDNPEGLNVPDLTSNDNYGTLYNIRDFRYSWSGAPVGYESVYDYSGINPSDFSVNLSSSDNDDFTVTGSSGTIKGIQLYRVDAPAMRGPISSLLPGSTSPFTSIDPLRYWGVKVIGSGSPTYNLVYNYDGHPGILDESSLKLVARDNLADDSWADLSAILNTGTNTLSASGLIGTEFALSSSTDNPFPVELSSFTAVILNKKVILNWRTETEVANFGFDLERSSDGITFNKIGFVEGNGNSNSPNEYTYSDDVEKLAGKLYYRLKQIDSDGSFSYSQVISVVLGVPDQFVLNQNYPNPFNPSTIISWQMPIRSHVTIKLYDMLGSEVTTLINEEKEAGYYNIEFNANELASGIYFYNISAGIFNSTKKMVLVR